MREIYREYPNEELKEVEEGKGNRSLRVAGSIAVFLETETIVGLNKNGKDCLKIFQLPWKTPASSCQCWDIMAQISVDTLHREGVIFVVNIEDMLPRKHDIQISEVSICAISFRPRSCVHHLLNRPGGLVAAHNMAYDLPWFPTHHGHNVDIFPGFGPRLVLQVPVQLIQFHCFHTGCGFFFSLPLSALFLSNSRHWICSFPVSFLRPGH